MEQLLFSLPDFNGPLDLLLHLISEHKLNLYDIDIVKLVDQYMAFLQQSNGMDMDLTGDFLEMASRLVYMKSVMLLPARQEEKQQLISDLEGQLIEYQLCKQIAQKLKEQYNPEAAFVRQPMPGIVDNTYRRRHQPQQLVHALVLLQGKIERRLAPPKAMFSGIVAKRVVSVTSRIIFVLRRLVGNTAVSFKSLFVFGHEKSEHVATFMAILELIKGKRVVIDDADQLHLIKKKEQNAK